MSCNSLQPTRRIDRAARAARLARVPASRRTEPQNPCAHRNTRRVERKIVCVVKSGQYET